MLGWGQVRASILYFPLSWHSKRGFVLGWGRLSGHLVMSLYELHAGYNAVFTIIAKDQLGNQRKKGGADFAIEMIGPAKMTSAAVVDNRDGTYTFSYNPQVAGRYRINISNNSEPISGSPFMLQVPLSSKDMYFLFSMPRVHSNATWIHSHLGCWPCYGHLHMVGIPKICVYMLK